ALLGRHIDTAPHRIDLVPCAGDRMAEVAPVDIVDGGAFVVQFLTRLVDRARYGGTGGLLRLLHVGLVANPRRATAAEPPIEDRPRQRRPEVGIVLDVEVSPALKDQRGDAADGVGIAMATVDISFRHTGERRTEQYLDVAPEDVEPGVVLRRAGAAVLVAL